MTIVGHYSPRKSPARKVAKSPARKSPARKENFDKIRKGPASHAKEHRVGSIKEGMDGNLWKIKMITKKDGTKYKRWVRI